MGNNAGGNYKSRGGAGEAEAHSYSNTPEPDEDYNYFTYAGDMSPEDHDRMVAAINADRARLAEVQDRLIRIDVRRRELAYLNFEGKDKVDSKDRDVLLEEDSWAPNRSNLQKRRRTSAAPWRTPGLRSPP